MAERIPCPVPVGVSNSVTKALEADGWFCSGIAPKDRVVCARGDRIMTWRLKR